MRSSIAKFLASLAGATGVLIAVLESTHPTGADWAGVVSAYVGAGLTYFVPNRPTVTNTTQVGNG